MNTITATTEAVVAWAKATVPAIQGTYDFATDKKTQPLPDAAAEIQDVSISLSDGSNFPHYVVQQGFLRVYKVNLLLVVAPNPPETASDQLESFVDQLTASVLADQTLGGRVGACSPLFRSTFTPPFVEFDDGTRGRLATIELAVGELIDVNEA